MMNHFLMQNFTILTLLKRKRAEVPNDKVILVNNCLMDQFSHVL